MVKKIWGLWKSFFFFFNFFNVSICLKKLYFGSGSIFPRVSGGGTSRSLGPVHVRGRAGRDRTDSGRGTVARLSAPCVSETWWKRNSDCRRAIKYSQKHVKQRCRPVFFFAVFVVGRVHGKSIPFSYLCNSW